MREGFRSLARFPSAWLLLVLGNAMVPTLLGAQTEASPAWAIVPFVGFGAVVENGDVESAGMEAALDIEYGGTRWRLNGYSSLRGLGVSCSHACFDGGLALAVGASRWLGAVWIGGGIGAMKQLGEWQLLPYGRLSLDSTPIRFDVRVELPQGSGQGVYIPILVGFPLAL